jgi:hypothetical protein
VHGGRLRAFLVPAGGPNPTTPVFAEAADRRSPCYLTVQIGLLLKLLSTAAAGALDVWVGIITGVALGLSPP